MFSTIEGVMRLPLSAEAQARVDEVGRTVNRQARERLLDRAVRACCPTKNDLIWLEREIPCETVWAVNRVGFIGTVYSVLRLEVSHG